MSGAQPKAATIAGCIGVICEIDEGALMKRHAQGWVQEVSERGERAFWKTRVRATTKLNNIFYSNFTSHLLRSAQVQKDPQECIQRIKLAKKNGESISIGFLGNVVTMWEALVDEEELVVELGSDQTSLHNPYLGGYYPVQCSFEESRVMMHEDPVKFKGLVQATLRRHAAALNKLTERGLKFWDYGNAFLVECFRAGAEIMVPGCEKMSPEDGGKFRYPSYVQDIMGDVFSLGFGPFRWVCCR